MSEHLSERIDGAALELLALVTAHRKSLGDAAEDEMLRPVFRLFDAAEDARVLEGKFHPRSWRERQRGRGLRRMWRGLAGAMQRLFSNRRPRQDVCAERAKRIAADLIRDLGAESAERMRALDAAFAAAHGVPPGPWSRQPEPPPAGGTPL